MKTLHIILIGIIIVLLLISIIIFIKNRKKTQPVQPVQPLQPLQPLPNRQNAYDISNNLLGKTIYVNVDTYNKLYNFNYEGGKLYKNNDFINSDISGSDMFSSVATVITEPETKEIFVDDKKVILYITTIEYDAINFIKDSSGNKHSNVSVKMDLLENLSIYSGINTIKLYKTLTQPSINLLKCNSDIAVTKPIKKDDKITVYYKYGNTDIDRFMPPFFPEEYVTV